MTLEEAHAWLEEHHPERWDYNLEWYGEGQWVAGRWFGPADEEYEDKKGTFLQCVDWLKAEMVKRNAQTTLDKS